MSVISICRLYLAVLCFCLCAYNGHAQGCNRRHVTISELEDIFIGRCVDFQTTIHPEHFCSSGMKDCQDLWKKFSSPFLNNPPCNVTADLYSDFVTAAHHPIIGKQLFYSGLGGFAQRYSSQGRRFTIQEDTLIGHLGNGLSFCGGDAGNDSTMPCERWNPETCPNTASGDFWVAGSRNFAQNAIGNVYVLLNATRDPIYKATSFFNKYEVPELRTGVVKKVTALLINDSPSTKRDPCGTDESVEILKTTLNEKNIDFDCKENPRDLVYLYCVDHVEMDVCRTNVPSLIDEAAGFHANFQLILLVFFVHFFFRK